MMKEVSYGLLFFYWFLNSRASAALVSTARVLTYHSYAPCARGRPALHPHTISKPLVHLARLAAVQRLETKKHLPCTLRAKPTQFYEGLRVLLNVKAQ